MARRALSPSTTIKVEGRSARGINTSDIYSLTGFSEAPDRAAKECSS